MKTHYLKVWPSYFEALVEGRKSFELRKDDRGFSVGDVLVLQEWDPALESYTGRQVIREVEYIARDVPGFGLMQGFCIMSIIEEGCHGPEASQEAKDIVDLLHGAPGPYLETENSFFGRKHVDSSMKDSLMETDCGGALITKGKMTYGQADALAAAVDLTDYPRFISEISPNVYWRSPYEKVREPGLYFVGEVWWSIYSYLTTLGYIRSMTPASYGKGHPRPYGPESYDNTLEYLYNEVLKRLVADGVYTADPEWRWFTRSAS